MQVLKIVIIYTLQKNVPLFCFNGFFVYIYIFWLFQNGMILLGSKCVERHINQERGKKGAIYSFTVPLGNHCLSFINMHFSTI